MTTASYLSPREQAGAVLPIPEKTGLLRGLMAHVGHGTRTGLLTLLDQGVIRRRASSPR